MELTVKRFITGPIETNTYVLSQENGTCILFDPSGGCRGVLDYIKEKELSPEAIAYDTEYVANKEGLVTYEHAELPKGLIMRLLFDGDKGMPFTTFQKCSQKSLNSYKGKIGKTLSIVITEEQIKLPI